MAPPDDDDDLVKDALAEGRVPLDPATQAELERWFGLPSATQLEEEGKQAAFADEEMQQVVERREKALANIDPAFVDSIYARTQDRPSPIKPSAHPVDVVIDDSIALFDHGMVDRALTIAEPRTYDLPDELKDDLRDCTPQALLRDLHRPENFFDKTFEIVDPAEDLRLDIVAEVRNAMRASWRLPSFPRKPVDESRDDIAAVHATHRQPWTSFLPLLPNRRVRE